MGRVFKPSKSKYLGESHRPKTVDSDRFRRRRPERHMGRALSPDTFDVDLHRVEDEGLRITVENRGADLFVADPLFYDEIQRHMSHSDEPDTRNSEIGYENISDSADSDSPSMFQKNAVRHQSGPGFDDSHLYNKLEHAAHRKDSSSRASCHSRSRSPSHGRKRSHRQVYDLKRQRRSRSHSNGRSDSRNKKLADKCGKKRPRSDSREQSGSHSHTKSRPVNHRRSRSRSVSHKHSRSSERSGSKCSGREGFIKSMSGRRSHSKEKRMTHPQGLSNDNNDSVPPWIKDPSKAMSVEEIEKYLESKLKQAELQNQPCPVGISDRVRHDLQLPQGGTYTEPSDSGKHDAQCMDQCMVDSPVIKESPPLDLYEDLPEQPRLATPPKTTVSKPFKSILKNKTVEVVKQDEKPVEDSVISCVMLSTSAVSENQPNTLIPGLSSTPDIEDEDKFLYGSTDILKPISDEHEKRSCTEASYFEPVFTGGYSKMDPGWEMAPTKVWSGSIADEQSPEEEVKKEDDNTKLDPTIQNILKSIGFNFELSKLMQQKAQSQKKSSDGISIITAGNSFPLNSSEKLNSRKGRYNRKSSLEMSYEERARRYREEQMKFYQISPTEPTSDLSRLSQDSTPRDNQPFSVYPSVSAPVSSNQVPFNSPANIEHDISGPELLHAVKLSGLQQLQSEYCMNDGNRLLSKEKIGNWSEIEKKSSHSSMFYDKRPDPSCMPDVHNHESISKRTGPRKIDKQSRDSHWRMSNINVDEDHDFWRCKQQETHAAALGQRRIVLPPKERNSSPGESKGQDGFDGSAKKLLAMNMEDKEGLMIELEKWQKRLNMLERELIRLKQEEKEMMRKQQRLRQCNSDSLLKDNVDLQEDIKVQMTLLSRAAEINTKLLLSGRSGDLTNDVDYLSEIKEKVDTRDEKVRSNERPPSYEVNKDRHSSSDKKVNLTKQLKHKSSDSKPSEGESSSLERGKTKRKLIDYEYFDPGDHWCKQCNRIFGKCQALFQHLHSTKHIDTFERPWLQETLRNSQRSSGKTKGIAVPLKGVEFMVPARAFYCVLCKEFAGDILCAEDHLKSQSHNAKYQSFIEDNQSYEMRYNQAKTASCPLLEDAQHTGDEDSILIDLPAAKTDQKREHKNPFGKIKEEKGEKLKREENISKRDNSNASKDVAKRPSVNFKWKGKMPMIGKSPAYKKAASATESDNKKVLFTVKNRSSTLTKPQPGASQEGGAQLLKECKSILKNKQIDKQPASSDVCFDSSSGPKSESTIVKLEDIALPQMPPPHTCYGPANKPESSSSSSSAGALVNCEPVGSQENSAILSSMEQKHILKNGSLDPVSIDLSNDGNSGRDDQNVDVSVNNIALPPAPLLDNCFGPKAKSANSRDVKTVECTDVQSSQAVAGVAVAGIQTLGLVNEKHSSSEKATERDPLPDEVSSTSLCSTTEKDDSGDAKTTIVKNTNKDDGKPC